MNHFVVRVSTCDCTVGYKVRMVKTCADPELLKQKIIKITVKPVFHN